MRLAPADHRPWPVPALRPAMVMVWHELLFMHWPVHPDRLRPLIPAGLSLDTRDGWAWLGIVPFHMTGIRAWGWPAVPCLSAFCELNVRTYVTAGGKSGVYFFSLDAASRVAVRVARRLFHLPYMDARMSSRSDGGRVCFLSRRTHRGEPPAELRVRYGPTGPVFASVPGSLEYFLSERYCLYAEDPEGGLHRSEIHHEPWPLQPAAAEVEANTMAVAIGVELPERPPHLLYAQRLEVPAWWPLPVEPGPARP